VASVCFSGFSVTPQGFISIVCHLFSRLQILPRSLLFFCLSSFDILFSVLYLVAFFFLVELLRLDQKA
jgi:hypothetical protein